MKEVRRDFKMWPRAMLSLAGHLHGDMVDDRRQSTEFGWMPNIWSQNQAAKLFKSKKIQ